MGSPDMGRGGERSRNSGEGAGLCQRLPEARRRSGWDIFRLGEAQHQGQRQLGHPSETPLSRSLYNVL